MMNVILSMMENQLFVNIRYNVSLNHLADAIHLAVGEMQEQPKLIFVRILA